MLVEEKNEEPTARFGEGLVQGFKLELLNEHHHVS